MSFDAVLAPSALPYQLPDFAAFAGLDWLAVFDEAFARHRLEVEEIAASPDAPTFANTVEALERAGRELARVTAVFASLTSTDTDETLEAAQTEVWPRYSAHEDAIHLDRRLFARIDAVHGRRTELDDEARRLVERYHLQFTRSGAGLDDAGQATLRDLNTELSTLTTRFQQYALAETNGSAVWFDDVADLAGLPDDAIAAARAAADADGRPGYKLALGYPTNQPLIARLDVRDSRRRLLEAALSRGSRGGDTDTRDLIARIASLRAERAALFGYPHHAAYTIADQTAGTAEAASGMLERLAAPAVANACRELAELEEVAGHPIEAWDWAYYARIADERAQEGSEHEADVGAYLELGDVVTRGAFRAANLLYGLTFTERTDLALHHPDARAWEVFDENGTGIGLFIGDYFARPSKRGGAWMTSFVDQSELLSSLPVVINVCNFVKPVDGKPALLSVDEATTVFHEFGHALHGLLSRVRYPYFSGTSVPRDFVEFPSQFNEMWLTWPTVLGRFRHHATGEPIPASLRDRLTEHDTRGEGFATVEYLCAAVIDLAWHTLAPGETVDDVEAFERAALERAGLYLPQLPSRYRGPYFSHIFSGGYSAGYYSYIWSEVLDADASAWFAANGGATRENGERLRTTVLSRGGSVDAEQAYREFRGAAPDIAPLLARRGLD
ncbi:M3 family metallopeptidase [Tsukamurella sp. 8J]|uniref:M3 family metallopeptidase n=1 Tax=Tsukamurella sp. 8J TaxID=3031962 RepID=UPI0023B93EC4|nr:M3 family metallopeptidase [Tsukamurella sp. 8J]MDF0530038.1 M3 family metallopeptidase [Tsukamurella sp. 8J]